MPQDKNTADIPVWSVKDDIRVGSLVLSSKEARKLGISMEKFAGMCASLHAFMREIKEQALRIAGSRDGYIVQPLGNQVYVLAFLDRNDVSMVLVDNKNKEVRQTISIAEYNKVMSRATDVMWKVQNVVEFLNKDRTMTRYMGDHRADEMARSVKDAINPARAGPEKKEKGNDYKPDIVYRFKDEGETR